MTALLVLVAFAGLVISAFFSGSETGLYCVDRLRLRVDAQRGDRRAEVIAELVDRSRDTLNTLLVGNNLANYVLTVVVAYLLTTAAGVTAGASELYTTLIVTPIVFVFGEVVPKTLFQRRADALMRAGASLLRIAALVLYLPVRFLDRLTRPVIRLFDPGGLSEMADPRSRVATLLQEAIAGTDTTGDHRAYIDRVFGLSQVAIQQVMVPRNRVIAIRSDASRSELEALARKHPHSRILVHERSPRRVTGYVAVHQILADTSWTQVGARARPVPELAAHDSVATALVRLQQAGEAMAAVVDRGGLLLGLVTRKDLVEELTGELPEW